MFVKKPHTAHDFELNLTPIIDCFVTLICFMLLSTTYVNLVGLDAKVPVAVPSSSPLAKKDPTFKLELNVKSSGMELIASGAGRASGKKWIPLLKQEVNGTRHDLTALHEQLVRIKQERPKEFSIYFNSDSDMPYEELVRFMDATRNLGKTDAPLMITDERNGKPVQIDLLFPDFVMANLTGK